MSFKSWSKLYYSKPARATTKAEAVQHSLTKWEGLLLSVLEQHGLCRSGAGSSLIMSLDGNDHLNIDDRSCSLCFHYYNPNKLNFTDVLEEGYSFDSARAVEHACATCPLAIARGGVPCDTVAEHLEEAVAPYSLWLHTADPQPMIEWLKITLQEQR